MLFDLITIGDTAFDVFLEIDEASVSCDLHRDACLICLNYADKIPVSAITKIPGVGNAANVAVGGARLGLKTAIYTVLGADDVADEVTQLFRKERVSLDYVRRDRVHDTNFSTVLLFHGERTILTHAAPRKYALPVMKPAKWLYVTALGQTDGKIQKQVIQYVKKNKTRLAVNPGSYQLRAGIKKLEPLLAITDVLFLNKQEAHTLLGVSTMEVHALARTLQHRGPRIVVITDADNGSYAYDGTQYYACPVMKVTMKERTGAGDAFATGCLAGLFYGQPLPTALQWGAANAASVVQYVGAQQGLLTKTRMQRLVKSAGIAVTQEVGI